MITTFEPFRPKIQLHIRTGFLQSLWDKYVPVSSKNYHRISLVYLNGAFGAAQEPPKQVQLLVSLILNHTTVKNSLERNQILVDRHVVNNWVSNTASYYLEQLKRVDFQVYRSLKQYLSVTEQAKEQERRCQSWEKEEGEIQKLQERYQASHGLSLGLEEFTNVWLAQEGKHSLQMLFQSAGKKEYEFLSEALIWSERKQAIEYIRNCTEEKFFKICKRLEEERRTFVPPKDMGKNILLEGTKESGRRETVLQLQDSALVSLEGGKESGWGKAMLQFQDSAPAFLEGGKEPGWGKDMLQLQDSAPAFLEGGKEPGDGETVLQLQDSAPVSLEGGKEPGQGETVLQLPDGVPASWEGSSLEEGKPGQGSRFLRQRMVLLAESFGRKEFRRFYQRVLFLERHLEKEETRWFRTGIIWKNAKKEVMRQLEQLKGEEVRSFWEKFPAIVAEICEKQEGAQDLEPGEQNQYRYEMCRKFENRLCKVQERYLEGARSYFREHMLDGKKEETSWDAGEALVADVQLPGQPAVAREAPGKTNQPLGNAEGQSSQPAVAGEAPVPQVHLLLKKLFVDAPLRRDEPSPGEKENFWVLLSQLEQEVSQLLAKQRQEIFFREKQMVERYQDILPVTESEISIRQLQSCAETLLAHAEQKKYPEQKEHPAQNQDPMLQAKLEGIQKAHLENGSPEIYLRTENAGKQQTRQAEIYLLLQKLISSLNGQLENSGIRLRYEKEMLLEPSLVQALIKLERGGEKTYQKMVRILADVVLASNREEQLSNSTIRKLLPRAEAEAEASGEEGYERLASHFSHMISEQFPREEEEEFREWRDILLTHSTQEMKKEKKSLPEEARPIKEQPPGACMEEEPWSSQPSSPSMEEEPWSSQLSSPSMEEEPWSSQPSSSSMEEEPWSSQLSSPSMENIRREIERSKERVRLQQLMMQINRQLQGSGIQISYGEEQLSNSAIRRLLAKAEADGEEGYGRLVNRLSHMILRKPEEAWKAGENPIEPSHSPAGRQPGDSHQLPEKEETLSGKPAYAQGKPIAHPQPPEKEETLSERLAYAQGKTRAHPQPPEKEEMLSGKPAYAQGKPTAHPHPLEKEEMLSGKLTYAQGKTRAHPQPPEKEKTLSGKLAYAQHMPTAHPQPLEPARENGKPEEAAFSQRAAFQRPSEEAEQERKQKIEEHYARLLYLAPLYEEKRRKQYQADIQKARGKMTGLEKEIKRFEERERLQKRENFFGRAPLSLREHGRMQQEKPSEWAQGTEKPSEQMQDTEKPLEWMQGMEKLPKWEQSTENPLEWAQSMGKPSEWPAEPNALPRQMQQNLQVQTSLQMQPNLQSPMLNYAFPENTSPTQKKKEELQRQEEAARMESLRRQLEVRVEEVEQKLKQAENRGIPKENVRDITEKVKKQLHEELHMERLRRGLL